MNPLQKALLDMYLDYVNNFLTIEKWAEHYGISENLARAVYNEFKTDTDMAYFFSQTE